MAPIVSTDPTVEPDAPWVSVKISHFGSPTPSVSPPTTAVPNDSLCDAFGRIPQVQAQAEPGYICGNDSGVTLVNGVYEFSATGGTQGELISAAMMQPRTNPDQQPFDWWQSSGVVPHATAIAIRDDYIARNAHGGPAPTIDTTATTAEG